MAAIARTQSFAGRQTMVDEGEPAESLFNITSGAVKPYKLLPDGRRLSFEGDFLGSVLNDYYSYTAEAVNDVTLCRFPKARVEALSEEFPKFEKQLPEVASTELAQAQDQMLLLGRKTSGFFSAIAFEAVERAWGACFADLPADEPRGHCRLSWSDDRNRQQHLHEFEGQRCYTSLCRHCGRAGKLRNFVRTRRRQLRSRPSLPYCCTAVNVISNPPYSCVSRFWGALVGHD